MKRSKAFRIALTLFCAATALLLVGVPILFGIETPCWPCFGSGKVTEWPLQSHLPVRTYPCPDCDATGRISLAKRLVHAAQRRAPLPIPASSG